MAQVSCQIEIPTKPNEEASALTVGREFLLHCRGPWPAMKSPLPEMRLEEADKYKIKLLDFKFISTEEAELKVTSYKAGQHKIKAVQLVDGDQSVVLSDLDFTVNSVINQQEPPAEPFGPFGPLPMGLPLWYSLTLILVVLAFASWIGWRWRLRSQRKKMLAEMRLDQQVQDPLGQFFQVVRKAHRKYGFFAEAQAKPEEVKEFVDEIGGAFKMYLARHLKVPTQKWPDRRILSDIKKNHPEFYAEFYGKLQQNLSEISRAQRSENMTGKDCQQLMDLLRKLVDQMEVFFKREDA